MSSLKESEEKNFLKDLSHLFGYLSTRRKWQLALLLLLQVTSAFSEAISLGAVIPFLHALTNVSALMENKYVAVFLDLVEMTQPNQVIMLMAGLFGVAIVIANGLRLTTFSVQHYLTAVIATDLGVQLFKKTLYQPYTFFLRNNSSDLVGMLTGDLRGAIGVVQNTLTIVTQGLMTSFVAIGLLIYNTRVALALSVLAGIAYTAITLMVRKRLLRNSVKVSDNYRKVVKVLQEGFGGIRYIALDQTHPIFIDQYARADTSFRRSLANNTVIGQAPKFFVEAIGVIAISLLAIVSAAQSEDISLVIPLLGFLVVSVIRLLPAIQQMYASLSGLFGLRASLLRVAKMLSSPPSPLLPSSMGQPFKFENRLTFQDVWFDYNEESDHKQSNDWILKDLNFSIEPKTTVAFVGHTGSGKSTMADLILGLLTPQKGRITVDGNPLEGEKLKTWQSGVSHVPQTIFLTDSSIAENIAFGVNPEFIDMQRVIDAARHAKIDEFIQDLPNQYNQLIGERGVRLSGGQCQRIGIARALYKEPSVIIFDEATSALDLNMEKEVMKAVDGLSQELTIILIAHRLSTVQRADRIFLLERGRFIAQGSYEELLKVSSSFKTLVHGTV